MTKKNNIRILIKNLSNSINWQKLKDIGRQIDDIAYADIIEGIDGERLGVIEYFDQQSALKAQEILNGKSIGENILEVIGYDKSLVQRVFNLDINDKVVEGTSAEKGTEVTHIEKSNCPETAEGVEIEVQDVDQMPNKNDPVVMENMKLVESPKDKEEAVVAEKENEATKDEKEKEAEDLIIKKKIKVKL